MKIRNVLSAAVAASLATAGIGLAQSVEAPPVPVAPSVATPGPAPDSPSVLVIPAGHPVELELLEVVSSKEHLRGHQFGLRLASPIVVDGVELVPAGALGMGEVTSAAKAGAGGKAGELMINARYIDHNGVRIMLRTMKIGVRGQDNTMAALLVAQAVGPFAMFVTGGNIVLPGGTFARAKVAQTTVMPLPGPPAATTADTPANTSTIVSGN